MGSFEASGAEAVAKVVKPKVKKGPKDKEQQQQDADGNRHIDTAGNRGYNRNYNGKVPSDADQKSEGKVEPAAEAPQKEATVKNVDAVPASESEKSADAVPASESKNSAGDAAKDESKKEEGAGAQNIVKKEKNPNSEDDDRLKLENAQRKAKQVAAKEGKAKPKDGSEYVLPPQTGGYSVDLVKCDYKLRLQRWTQRNNHKYADYFVESRGEGREQKFTSIVKVGSRIFASNQSHSRKKDSEQDAAKVAYEVLIIEAVPADVLSMVEKGLVLSKSILNEYAVKVESAMPTYFTHRERSSSKMLLHVSSVAFGGSLYTGEAAIKKKVAEQKAALAAIRSIVAENIFLQQASGVMEAILRSKEQIFMSSEASQAVSSKMPLNISSSNALADGDDNSMGLDSRIKIETPRVLEGKELGKSAGSTKGKPKIEAYEKDQKGAGALITPAKIYNPAADLVLSTEETPKKSEEKRKHEEAEPTKETAAEDGEQEKEKSKKKKKKSKDAEEAPAVEADVSEKKKKKSKESEELPSAAADGEKKKKKKKSETEDAPWKLVRLLRRIKRRRSTLMSEGHGNMARI